MARFEFFIERLAQVLTTSVVCVDQKVANLAVVQDMMTGLDEQEESIERKTTE
jgi:hypothetical protein